MPAAATGGINSEELQTGRGPGSGDSTPIRGAESHFALVRLLEPLAKPDQAALLQGSQVAQVPLDVVCVQFV